MEHEIILLNQLGIFIERRKKEMNDDGQKISNKINYWKTKIENSDLSNKNKSKKIKELISLGKFLIQFDLDLINGNRESPDFIIHDGNNIIGIELRDLITDQDDKKNEGIVKTLLKDVEKELGDEIKCYVGTYHLGFNIGLKVEGNVKEIKEDIINKIKNRNFKSKFLQWFDYDSADHFYICNNQSTVSGNLLDSIVIEAIEAKENKVDKYKEEKNIEKLWLLLVIDGLNQSGSYSEINKSLLENPINSKFDKVFILNSFNSKTYKLNINTI